ncbi:MAG: anti-sigma factor antagonist [Planctomycetota bacterium]|nr:MAG: anti-sigma factor antagonist [Planctomycetota bacterium]
MTAGVLSPKETEDVLKPSVELREEPGVLVAEFWDCLRMDPKPVVDLRIQYSQVSASSGLKNLIIDLNGVEFSGSASLSGFLALSRIVKQTGGRMVFCNVDINVKEVFQVSKLDAMFVFSEDKDSARKILGLEAA